jgi:tetratricopeptide (TPR) repeat protein
MLETLREFALEQLEAHGDVDAARRQHAGYYLALAERARPELTGPRQKAWFEQLQRDMPNLDAALVWCQAQDPATGLRLAEALLDLWRVGGRLTSLRRWLTETLARSAAVPMEARARGLLAAGLLARVQDRNPEARALLTQAQQLFLELEDTGSLARVLCNLGTVSIGLGEYAAAQAQLEQTLSLARQASAWTVEATALNCLGILAAERGDFAGSHTLTRQALALHEARQDWRNMAGLRLNLGLNAHDEGDHAAAVQYLQSSLDAARELGDHDMTAIALLGLGNAFLALNDLGQARACLEETLREREARGETDAAALSTLGRVLHRSGEYAAARARLVEALILRLEAHAPVGIARSLENLADLEHSERRDERAARWLGAARAIRQAMGAPSTPAAQTDLERLAAEVRAALGEAAFEQAWTSGHALSVEAAVALAVAQSSRPDGLDL